MVDLFISAAAERPNCRSRVARQSERAEKSLAVALKRALPALCHFGLSRQATSKRQGMAEKRILQSECRRTSTTRIDKDLRREIRWLAAQRIVSQQVGLSSVLKPRRWPPCWPCCIRALCAKESV